MIDERLRRLLRPGQRVGAFADQRNWPTGRRLRQRASASAARAGV